jgi:nucleoside-diphosphate-sugar epimerase
MMTELIFFVTGASGFIGSNLIKLLNRKGYTPYALLRETSRLDLLENADYVPVYGDVTSDDVIALLPENVNTIVHCAGATKALNECDYYNENAQGTLNILNSAKERLPGLRRVILLSSQAAAGPCQLGQCKSESDGCNPINQYGISKARMEQTIAERFPHMPLVIVRPPSVYGPGDRESLKLFKMVKLGLVPSVNRNRLTMSFVYIDDLLEGIFRLAAAPVVPDSLYNITSQDEVAITDFYKSVSKHMNKRYLTLNVPKPLISAMARISLGVGRLTGNLPIFNPDKVKEMKELRWVVSGQRFRTLFPDMSFTPLDTGTKRSLAWYRQKGWL